eukprot:gnl/Hemi2/13929_TR4726_c0_g1_i1.p1 gnl/Hemi2/13929_TR4726_c0_g1~~gnl/Hemi2/13929_TR4726_c0_g1_i1.p1  ORF type:complete len:262 (+),score=48.58 gnl/Hemi2/13929_TR4726_c0_g1_i1:72-788(+)
MRSSTASSKQASSARPQNRTRGGTAMTDTASVRSFGAASSSSSAASCVSAGTAALLSGMMKDSGLTKHQSNKLWKSVADGGTLPGEFTPKIDYFCHHQQSRAAPNPRAYTATKRHQSQIPEEAFQRGDYTPKPTKNLQDEKLLLQTLNEMPHIDGVRQEPVPPRTPPTPPPPEDMFKTIQAEIEERQQFLADMRAVKRGKQYEAQITQEIEERVRELQFIHAKRMERAKDPSSPTVIF